MREKQNKMCNCDLTHLIYYLAWKRKGGGQGKAWTVPFKDNLFRCTKQEEASSKKGTVCFNLDLTVVNHFSHTSP